MCIFSSVPHPNSLLATVNNCNCLGILEVMTQRWTFAAISPMSMPIPSKNLLNSLSKLLKQPILKGMEKNHPQSYNGGIAYIYKKGDN